MDILWVTVQHRMCSIDNYFIEITHCGYIISDKNQQVVTTCVVSNTDPKKLFLRIVRHKLLEKEWHQKIPVCIQVVYHMCPWGGSVQFVQWARLSVISVTWKSDKEVDNMCHCLTRWRFNECQSSLIGKPVLLYSKDPPFHHANLYKVQHIYKHSHERSYERLCDKLQIWAQI